MWSALVTQHDDGLHVSVYRWLSQGPYPVPLADFWLSAVKGESELGMLARAYAVASEVLEEKRAEP